ncbi:hypothetical protein SDC9_155641 [bioreactor metagenome]|uniref:Uncharacterized protein n=1 Tax=bioreactor metagenome TaxID=1076179 RepID=A0A645F4K4_9ZZZZ
MSLYVVTGSGGNVAGFNDIIFSVARCEFGNFIAVIGSIITQVPGEILGADYIAVYRKFNAGIRHGADVADNTVFEVGAGRNFDDIDQVVRIFLVIIHRSGDPVIQKTKVYSGVVCGRFFPFQILIIGIRTIGCQVFIANGIISSVYVFGINGDVGIITL